MLLYFSPGAKSMDKKRKRKIFVATCSTITPLRISVKQCYHFVRSLKKNQKNPAHQKNQTTNNQLNPLTKFYSCIFSYINHLLKTGLVLSVGVFIEMSIQSEKLTNVMKRFSENTIAIRL